MKTWKLVSGILSIVLFAMVSFQSCAAGVSNTLQDNGEVSGSAGLIVAIMLLVGGIVSIATKNGSKGGNIALIAVSYTHLDVYKRQMLIFSTLDARSCRSCAFVNSTFGIIHASFLFGNFFGIIFLSNDERND